MTRFPYGPCGGLEKRVDHGERSRRLPFRSGSELELCTVHGHGHSRWRQVNHTALNGVGCRDETNGCMRHVSQPVCHMRRPIL